VLAGTARPSPFASASLCVLCDLCVERPLFPSPESN
jgi:hypothetical protein